MNPKEQSKERKGLDFDKIEFLISDWDGTLTDSMSAYTKSFAGALNEALGIDIEDSREYFLSTAGEPLSNQLKTAARRFAGVEIQDSTPLENTFWRNLTGFKPDIIPGAKEFLTKLKKREVKIIVWSGTKTDVLQEKIKLLSFSGLVDYAIGNEPGSSTLVKGPGLFSKIAEYFGISEDELRQKSVVLGDGIGDIKAGISVGVPTIGIVKTQSKDELGSAGADLIVNNLESLTEFFQ